MDPLTHVALGAALGRSCFYRQLGTSAVIGGAVLAACPDLDLLYGAMEGPFGRLLVHRGMTHSLFFAPVVGTLAGWLLWRWRRGKGTDPGAGPWAWIGLCVLALLSHPLLDLFTSYGTQLFMPFSRDRYALHAIAIVDPAYSFMLAAGLAGSVFASNSRHRGWYTGAAVMLSIAYLLLGLRLNGLAESEATRQLEAAGIEVTEAHVFPTMLQLPHRRLVMLNPSEIRVGFISMWRPCPIEWGVAPRVANDLTEILRATDEGRIYAWFSGNLLATRQFTENNRRVVDLIDLRYGFEPDPLSGMWGIRGIFGIDGQLERPPERILDRPEVSAENIARLWADAFPEFCEDEPGEIHHERVVSVYR